ncbi:response regulator [Tamlana crocina]|uniref:histidine kinase n=1 Tax=Tamlana crocina TaxID=393006 RepID=A0ABX1DAU8_9FLAO|nr:response regulator [Tamlana crocina]NJX14163.1 response regulator [Tamlana crocina]
MNFLSKFMKSVKVKKKQSFFIFIFIAAILVVGYAVLEDKIYENTAAAILFIIAAGQVLVLQFFFKNQLKNDVVKTNLKHRIKELREEVEVADNLASEKSVYLANMSYEVRTPLSTVLGMMNMLKQTDLTADQRAQVEIAEYSSQHLLQLVNMITDNSEVENEGVSLNLTTMDLRSDLTKLFKVFEYQAWEKGLEFEYTFLPKDNDKFLLIGDSARIQQILINLINNAIKFTHFGKVSVIVDQSVGIQGEQIIAFYIKDTGIGIRPHVAKQILGHNKQSVNEPTLKDYRGRGIGLAISNKLVKMMGGQLKLESKENEGSTFYFSLQLKKTLNLKLEEETSQPILLEKLNVLVAEDNRTNQKVIKFLLERHGADCTFAKNGLEAVELYKILDFDMVFMDIYMPDMDGYQATKSIKETEKYDARRTPIIAVSASAFEEDINNAKLAGIDDFLAKPIEDEKLRYLLLKYSKKSA